MQVIPWCHDYSISNLLLKSWKETLYKEEGSYKNLNIFISKSILDEIKSIFHNLLRALLWLITKNIGHTSFGYCFELILS